MIGDQHAAIVYLLDAGADPNARYRDRNTALHTAAFFGRAEAATQLLDAGAEVLARNVHRETPLDSMRHDQRTTEFIAGLLQVPIDFVAVTAGRDRIREMLVSHGAISGLASPQQDSDPARHALQGSTEQNPPGFLGDLMFRFTYFPFFHHLWFLWFLCWLVAGFALVVVVSRPFPRIPVPSILIATPLCLLWLVPLTMLTQSFMHWGGAMPGFGPDTSAGLVPMPHVLAHYAIFFGFGALICGSPRAADRLGRGWWLQLPLALLLAPPALALALHTPWGRELAGDDGTRRLLADAGPSAIDNARISTAVTCGNVAVITFFTRTNDSVAARGRAAGWVDIGAVRAACAWPHSPLQARLARHPLDADSGAVVAARGCRRFARRVDRSARRADPAVPASSQPTRAGA